MYNQLTPEIIEEIKKVSNNVFLGEEINPDYAKDEMPIYGTHMPDLAVQPRSTEEVAAVMKICYENFSHCSKRSSLNQSTDNCGDENHNTWRINPAKGKRTRSLARIHSNRRLYIGNQIMNWRT